ncbi:5-oxoprolinase subunit B [Sporomusa silvacetica DSM 10669]|uniref:5-oxoprolinase subunit B n=1 Tax=Sporomusa silvacetica DSM 10669 TaxID=1123289 RepID=A0ABZ3ITW3_9FIRM|nr:5-oxoprolinase subunit PxpB [Sporomusa silvacetica]OZC19521.1 kinase A inhibitor [Sporomusa silvacetica DSM 10669]
MSHIKIIDTGEQELLISFEKVINKQINFKVQFLAKLVEQHLSKNIIEVVPTYCSLLIYFNPLIISRHDLKTQITQLIDVVEKNNITHRKARVLSIPVCYSKIYGPDLSSLAQYHGLSEKEVISIHTSTPYLIYMLGFTPGYAYLGGLSEKIATPRLKNPRTKVPVGSVGIGGKQTCFYTIECPGGFHLIGRTPISAFNFDLPQPFLFSAGDYLQFQEISQGEYQAIAADIHAGSYQPTVIEIDDDIAQ